MERIILVRAGALGDVVLTLPAVRALRHRYPAAHITVVGYRQTWEIAQNLVDEIRSVDESLVAALLTGAASPQLSTWLDGADLLVAWTVRDPSEAAKAARVRRIVHASPYPPPGVHASDWLLETIGAERSAWPVPDRPAGDGRIIIHPGAGAEWKRWPFDRFASLIRRLVSTGHVAEMTAGPADEEVVASVQELVATPLTVRREPSLCDLAATLRHADLFIGNDSGVTHLAAAVGLPTITLFGPTDPASWAPRGQVRVLRHCDATATEQGQIRVCDGACLSRISVDEVLEAAGTLLVDNRVDRVPIPVESRDEGSDRAIAQGSHHHLDTLSSFAPLDL